MNMNRDSKSKRESWGSRIGIIMAVAGSAVGLDFSDYFLESNFGFGRILLLPYIFTAG